MNELPSCSRVIERKARKDHKCMGCCAVISKGDKYQYTSGVWNCEPNDYKHCKNCARIISEFNSMDASLDWDEGPALDWSGVVVWLRDFTHKNWCGEEAAQDISKVFNLNIEYCRRVFGV